MTSPLSIVKNRIIELRKLQKSIDYSIPTLWYDSKIASAQRSLQIEPYQYLLDRIEKIKELGKSRKGFFKSKPTVVGKADRDGIIYNMFVRHTTAFDHNGDGELNLPVNSDGFRETGTFLKAIAMLPYIDSLGVDIIYLLPVTSIGIDGRKGTLGSPYAIHNPYKLDENLSEPALGLNVETEFAAFIEAAHLIGMKVVLEFVFRTGSIDSELALEHPEWFYWIKSDIENREEGSESEKHYGPPIFTEKELEIIKEKVESEDLVKLPPPHDIYQEMFTRAPNKTELIKNKIIGNLGKDKQCKIPGAFADWPPDDNQPAWDDVTYLRLFAHPDFNYIAYNTVRMYDAKLTKKSNRVEALWENICNIIPYYQDKFDIDGVMIDMGHALPSELRSEIVQRARRRNKNFIFWEENFTLSKKSVDDGYDAVVGYLPFDEYRPLKMKELLELLAEEGSPIPFFATPENHNTPRAASRPGGLKFAKLIWVVNSFLPAIRFIHSGYEVGETSLVNTGLDFTAEEIKKYPSDKLPLFSEAALNWTNPDEWTDFLNYISSIRDKYFSKFAHNCGFDNYKLKSLEYCETSNDNIISFARHLQTHSCGRKGKSLLFIGNMHAGSAEKKIYFAVRLPKGSKSFKDIISNNNYKVINNELILYLKPFEFALGEIVY